jgi:hypothetical protein
MNWAIVLLEVGENNEFAEAALPGKGTSTGVDVGFSTPGPTPWLKA